MPDLGSFHFLRPAWLLALLPAAVIVALLWRQGSAGRRWRGVIAPHLLEHLIVRPADRRRLRPPHLLAVVTALACLAAAGPSWRREPPPFTRDTAPLVVALDLSPTMEAADVRPSRLERARQKARDLLAERRGAATALIAYAGSAHLVLPLTDDPSLLEAYVTSLEPSLMPVAGKAPEAALALAQELLADEATPGTVLFLTDGIAAGAVPAFEAHAAAHRDQVLVLAVATARGGAVPAAGGGAGEVHASDRRALEALEERAGAWVTAVTVDDTDVRRIGRRIASHLADVQKEDAEGRWRDEGWWLVWPLLALTLVWFRKGWTIRWEA